MEDREDVTRLLELWQNGDEDALNQLLPLVYGELRQLAHRYMQREGAGHTLQTTALLNEAYLRLAGKKESNYQNRAHFIAAAAQVMRHLLVDHARAKLYEKRGGGERPIPIDESFAMPIEQAEEIVSLDVALKELQKLDPRKVKIVELRYFAGMNVEETAKALGIGSATVKREWAKAKAWLYQELKR